MKIITALMLCTSLALADSAFHNHTLEIICSSSPVLESKTLQTSSATFGEDNDSVYSNDISSTSIKYTDSSSFTSASFTSASTGVTSGIYTGDMTYYNIGEGSCGTPIATDESAIVALSTAMMGNGQNPNDNPKCGQAILITYQGKTTSATIYDTCAGCAYSDIDLSQGLFDIIAPNGNGRVRDVSWSFA